MTPNDICIDRSQYVRQSTTQKIVARAMVFPNWKNHMSSMVTRNNSKNSHPMVALGIVGENRLFQSATWAKIAPAGIFNLPPI